MYIFNMSVTNLQDIKIYTLKALCEVDCKKYELSAVIQYAHWRELAKLNAVNLSKIFFHH